MDSESDGGGENVGEKAGQAFYTLTGLDFDFDHIIILSAIYGAAILLSLLIVSFRFQRKRVQLSVIPRTSMPIVRSKDLPAKLKRSIVSGVDFTAAHKPQAPLTTYADLAHIGWGMPGTPLEDVHFKSAIAEAPRSLESVALKHGEHLARAPSMCMRDYILYLQTRFTLGKKLCAHVVRQYERARFTDDEFTHDEYESFMAKFQMLKQSVEDG